MKKFEEIRNKIKELSNLQKQNKPQRKLNHSMETGITPKVAEGVVRETRYELRHLFAAYAMLKGVERPLIKRPSNYNGRIIDEGKLLKLVELILKNKPCGTFKSRDITQ